MKTKFKIYLAILAIEILLGVVLLGESGSSIRPTAPPTAEDLKTLRQEIREFKARQAP